VIKEFEIAAEQVAEQDDYFRIFVVRDPLRRLVSFYYQWVVLHQTRWFHADEARQVSLRDCTFREFIAALQALAEKGLPFQHHLTPQTRILNAASVDEVVKLEEINERFRAINRRLGLDYAPRHLNQTAYSDIPRLGAFDLAPATLREEPLHPYQSFFDDELLRAATHIYAQDMALYASH